MKKIIILLLVSNYSYAQAYIGGGLQNKGMNLSIGALHNKFEIQGQIKTTMTSALDVTVEPTILFLTGGYQIPLTFEDDYNYSVTIQAGAGFRSFRDYKEDGNSMSNIKTDEKLVIGIEIGQHGHQLKWFASVKYCGKTYGGVGFRFYFWVIKPKNSYLK